MTQYGNCCSLKLAGGAVEITVGSRAEQSESDSETTRAT
jgi:hypothetical protein